MNLSKIHHIAIIVSDYEVAKEFYVNKLGFSVIRENYRPERKDWKLDLRVNEYTELEIFAEENPPKRVNRPEACGLRHLAFRVESVEQTVKELAKVGIKCEPIRVDDYTGEKMTFFHDPDAGVRFKTYSGLPFTYEIRKGRNGQYTKELWIDRRENSKSLAWSSVLLALGNIKKVGEVVERPKALGDIRGVTYIYGMFYRFGLIDVPDEAKEKMKKAFSKSF